MALTKEDFDKIRTIVKEEVLVIVKREIIGSENRILGELGRDYKTFSEEIKRIHQRIERLHPEEVRQ